MEKRLNSRNLSKKNFYYFGVSTIMDFYKIKILGRRQIVYYNGDFYYNGFYYNGVRLYFVANKGRKFKVKNAKIYNYERNCTKLGGNVYFFIPSNNLNYHFGI